MATRWGIVSTGKISNDFAWALQFLPHNDHEIVAVAARKKDDAIAFAKEHNVSIVCNSYNDLASLDSVEIVYIGTINSAHYSLCKMMLEAGKHVLCEKPLCLNYEDTESLISLAKKKRLFLMEGIWSRFFPLYDELRRLLSENVIGELLYLRVEMGHQICDVPRLKKVELGGGTLFDLGVYPLQLAVLVFGVNPTVVACGDLNSEGVDENIDCILKYPNGKTANFSTHSKITMENCATIYGTKGYIKINSPFWCPTSLVTPDGEKKFPIPFKCDKMNFANSEGLVYEAMEVRECIMKGLIESPKMSHSDSLTIAKLQAEIIKLIDAKVIH